MLAKYNGVGVKLTFDESFNPIANLLKGER